MSNVPEGAQLSEDGQWWWDETNQQWNAVEGGDQSGGGGGGGSFADKFVQEMSQAGVTVDPADVPEADTLKPAIEYAQNYINGMDDKMKAGFDAATKDDPASIVLSDDDINVAPALKGLLQDFDETQGKTISELLELAKKACDAAAGSA
jgi:hypothetical protein